VENKNDGLRRDCQKGSDKNFARQEKSATGVHDVEVRCDGKFWCSGEKRGGNNKKWRLVAVGIVMENSGVVEKYWETCHETENLGAVRNSARQEEIPKKKG
jgi:hypothetical protein